MFSLVTFCRGSVRYTNGHSSSFPRAHCHKRYCTHTIPPLTQEMTAKVQEVLTHGPIHSDASRMDQKGIVPITESFSGAIPFAYALRIDTSDEGLG